MTIYENVKAAVSVRQAAEHYGLQVGKSNMTCCPFHVAGASSISFAPPQAAGLIHSAAPPLPTKSPILREPFWHPSVKLYEDHFYCFGCGATGDVIDFTARLFGISTFEAVKKLAADFGIDPKKPPAAAALAKPKYPMIKAFREDELYCHRVLCDYLHFLESWKVLYAPKMPENIGVPAETQRSGFGGERTSSGVNETCRLRRGKRYGACEDEEERVKTVEILMKDGKMQELETRMERMKEEQKNGRAV